MSVQLDALSIAANRLCGVASWSQGQHAYAFGDVPGVTAPAQARPGVADGLVAYGAGHFVGVMDPQVLLQWHWRLFRCTRTVFEMAA
jgi:hypothetical protein